MAAQLILVRIDDRLIHGQVAIGWVKATQPQHLIVANDAVARDTLQKSLMEMAVPAHLEITVCSVKDVAALCQHSKLDKKRVLILFASPQDVLTAVKTGLSLKELNVGGMRYSPGKRQIMKAVAIDQEDVKCFRALSDLGIQIKIQMVPTDEPVDMRKYL